MASVFSLPNIISEFKSSIRLALPLIISELIYALNGFVATIMVAHLGKAQLAANALVWSIYIAVILFFIGVLCAVGIMVAQSFGAKDNESVGICFNQGLIMAVIYSVPMMLIIWAVPVILVWTKQDPEVIQYAKPYFYSLVWTALPVNFCVVIQQFLIAITKSRLVLFMSIITVPVEIFFYYVFLFGKFGFPESGLAGIGYGLTASHCLIVLFFGGYLYFSQELKIYPLFKRWWVINRKFLVEIFRIGLPLGFMWCSEVAFFAVSAIVIGLFGIVTLAAYQIADQYLMLALVILFALAQSVSVRVGNEAGSGDREKIKLTVMVHLAIGFMLISIFSIFYATFPQLAIGLDVDVNSEHFREVVAVTKRFFPIVGVLLIIDCLRIICNGALRGLKDTNFLLFISILGFWGIAMPSIYLLAFKFKIGGVGVWWGIVVGAFATGIMLLVRFNRLVKTIDLSSLITKK